MNCGLYNGYTCNIIFPDGIQFRNNNIILNFSFSEFASYVRTPNTLENCANMFKGTNTFNAPIRIPENVENCTSMLEAVPSMIDPSLVGNFNQNLVIPRKVTDVAHLLCNQANFDKSVIFAGNNVINASSMFVNCIRFNQPVTLPESVLNCNYVFANCRNLNSPVILHGNCFRAFSNCVSFNSSISVMSGNAYGMASYDANLGNSTSIYIDDTVTNVDALVQKVFSGSISIPMYSIRNNFPYADIFGGGPNPEQYRSNGYYPSPIVTVRGTGETKQWLPNYNKLPGQVITCEWTDV